MANLGGSGDLGGVNHDGRVHSEIGKSLQNSTRKTSSLKNYHTKDVQKMPKIMHN